MRALRVALLVVGAMLCGSAAAAEIEQFFMPGKLISGHQEYEAECTRCHVRLRDTTQKKLCLDCHELVAEDQRRKRGFHGRDRNASNLDCKACHSDHKGRDARVVWLDRDNFHHGDTDFRLAGRHQLAECTACHQPGDKFREAPQDCYSCHSEDDAHRGELGKQCGDCHAPSGWARSEFDHDRADFKLRDAHRRVSCDACHLDAAYDKTPSRCVDCHAVKDVHDNRFGTQCQDCHTEKKWADTIFDHGRDTDYRLEDAHRKVTCNACHGRNYLTSKKPDTVRSCYSCHRADDAHNESNGKKCQDCHSPRGWTYAEFDHDANTDFALNGAHTDLVCAACHAVGAESREIASDCYSCHKLDDSHAREQGTDCASCHNEVGWQMNVRFDHELTEFPLLGQHAAAGCETCHLSSVFREAGERCVDCHAGDDAHRESLGRDCARCHNPNAWLIWRFDHDETGFELRDAHAESHCHTCHREPLRASGGQQWRCIDCHWRDDVHQGNFGVACDNCHDRQRFDNVDPQALRSRGFGAAAEPPP
jgi:hypothetical protein